MAMAWKMKKRRDIAMTRYSRISMYFVFLIEERYNVTNIQNLANIDL